MFMTVSDIKQVILDLIADIDDEADFTSLDAGKPLRDELDLDSMDFLDIVMELRKRYKLQIPEADYPQLATLNSCVAYLGPKLAAF
jgi:acyl carrier protein